MHHDAVHLVAGPQLLAEQADRDLGDGHRVSRVHAQVRRERGVRLAAGVLHVHVRDGRDARVQVLIRGRVHHHRGVHAVEGAAFEEQNLAAATLLGRACR